MGKGQAVERVLAGDIGGTNARLRLYDRAGQKVTDETVVPSAGASSLGALLRDYLKARGARVIGAALGVAGPVIHGVAEITNLPWVIDERKLARELSIPRLMLLNDLAAVAVGCTRVARAHCLPLSAGEPIKDANVAVLSAGTGLGEAMLVWSADRKRYIPCATEGGHTDFAPNSEIEDDLLRFLRKKLGLTHISWERVLSGPGLGNLYEFFLERRGGKDPALERIRAADDQNAAITRLGLSGKSAPAADAVDLFARAYGAEAGNLALKGFALGGVYLCGRIATTIVPRKKRAFVTAMRHKGRMGDLLASVPLTIVTDPLVGLTGAGYLAARLAAE